jgi:hypothetical protein
MTRLIGAVQFTPRHASHVHVDEIIVAPHHRGRRVASTLLAAALRAYCGGTVTLCVRGSVTHFGQSSPSSWYAHLGFAPLSAPPAFDECYMLRASVDGVLRCIDEAQEAHEALNGTYAASSVSCVLLREMMGALHADVGGLYDDVLFSRDTRVASHYLTEGRFATAQFLREQTRDGQLAQLVELLVEQYVAETTEAQLHAARAIVPSCSMEGATRLLFIDSVLGVYPRLNYTAAELEHAKDRVSRRVPIRREDKWKQTRFVVAGDIVSHATDVHA